MKSKMKKKSIQVLFVFVTFLGVCFLNNNILTTNNQTKSCTVTITQPTEDNRNKIPLNSRDEYIGVTKTITKGSQGNIWNEDNLRDDDGNYDVTNFNKDSLSTHIKGRSAQAITRGTIGTTSGSVATALSSDDDNYVYMETTWDWDFPLDMKMRVGGYSYPSSYAGVYGIRIKLEIMVDTYALPPLDSGYLVLSAYSNQYGILGDLKYWIPYDEQPIKWSVNYDSNHDLVKKVRQGHCIDFFEVTLLDLNEQPFTITWINVDYIDIYYYYYEYIVDYSYELEFGENPIPDIQEFKTDVSFTIDLYDSVPGVDIYLADFTHMEWTKFKTTGSWNGELIQFTISLTPQDYINLENKMQIRFSTDGVIPYFQDSDMHLYVDLIEVDHSSVRTIDIKTPESKTYTEPMSGYYPATYGFENDKDGSLPNEWIETGQGPYQGKTTIISSKDGHNKTMRIHDDSGGGFGVRVTATQDFNAEQTSGTLELWIFFDNDPGDATDIRIENSSGTLLTIISAYDNKWRYINGTSWVMTGLSAINEWFHLSIDFCSAGTYKGLSSNTYKFTIRKSDGSIYYESPKVDYSDYTIGNGARITITSWQTSQRDTWVDAVGYSWDPNYNIGDNLNEGLLLSFEENVNLDWIGYSLDGQANKTILGNKTIPIPNNGPHIIQVLGEDPSNNPYNSQIVNFEIKLSIDGGVKSVPDDDDDDDDDDDEEDLLGPTLIIIGITSAVAVAGVAIYLIRKRRLLRE